MVGLGLTFRRSSGLYVVSRVKVCVCLCIYVYRVGCMSELRCVYVYVCLYIEWAVCMCISVHAYIERLGSSLFWAVS
jgi:hypothetical protein